MRHGFYILTLIGCLIFGQAFACSAPDKYVKGLVNSITKDLERHKTEDKLVKVLTARLKKVADVDYAASRIMGSKYRSLSSSQKSQFKSKLTEYVVNGFVKAMRQVDARKKLKFYPHRGAGGQLATIRTKYTARSGKNVRMDFIAICHSGQWKIQDVSIEGVRVVDGYVSQLRPILEKSGFKGLMSHLSKK